MLEAAQTLFDTSPISGILNFLPKEAKMIISVFTVLLLTWAGAHMGSFPHPKHYFAAAGENEDFVIAVINFWLNQYL